MKRLLPVSSKIELVKRFKSGESVTSICKQQRISRTILYRWIKRYDSAGPRAKVKSLSDKTPRGTEHWHSFTKNKEKQIVMSVRSHPEYSPKKLSKIFKISSYGAWKVLKRHDLNTSELRLKNSQRPQVQPFSFASKIEMFKEYEAGRPVSDICHKYSISRAIFYRWLKRYLSAKRNVQALHDLRPSGESHWRYNPSSKYMVLDIVKNHPEYSALTISQKLSSSSGQKLLSVHGVHNILKRLNLSTSEERIAFVKSSNNQEKVRSLSPQTLPKPQSFSRFISALPPPSRIFANNQVRLFVAIFFSSFLVSLLSLNAVNSIIRTSSFGVVLGKTFSYASLFFGIFFLIYSLKYYLSVALVLSFSRKNDLEDIKHTGFWSRLFGLSFSAEEASNGKPHNSDANSIGLQADLSSVILKSNPFVSVHLSSYNEKRVIDRLLTACTSFDYPNYEVIVADDSTDETVSLLDKWANHPRVKISHRSNRQGYKGGALDQALKITDPRAQFILVFDADFIPYPDTITQFLKYFQLATGGLEFAASQIDPNSDNNSNIAAVQGYQWHVLNKSENWITRGVRSEYSGSYVIERSGAEIYSGLKQISGSVYMIRRDVLQSVGWGTSITEDFELTLRLYEQGYKVVYTPYIQAPAEAVSTIKRLIRQRMRWAEGHSFNIKRMFKPLLASPRLTLSEKLELIYLAPYYLQAAFFILGTLCWFTAEVIFQVRLPFWTEIWGWSLVATNLAALPLMNMIGLFMEETEEKDYLGLFSFIVLTYIVAPFQAYAAVKGFIEKEEGPWFRTPKTGRITDTLVPGRIARFVKRIFAQSNSFSNAQHIAYAPGLNFPLSPVQDKQKNEEEVVSPYLSLTTANNRFVTLANVGNTFDIHIGNRVRRNRWLAKCLVVFCLISSLLLNNLLQIEKAGNTNTNLLSLIPSQNFSFTGMKSEYGSDENPHVSMQLPSKGKGIFSFLQPAKAYGDTQKVTADLFYKNQKIEGDPVHVVNHGNRGYAFDLSRPKFFRPGKYKLIAIVHKEDGDKQYVQDFRWGVIALNTQKSVYLKGETINFAMGVIDDAGETICDAKMELVVNVPSQKQTYTLSTNDKTIKYSPDCARQSVTNKPDYSAEFKTFNKVGTYTLTLKAETYNGPRTLTQKINIVDSVPVSLSRSSYPTRIYPREPYPVSISFTPQKDFTGTITENLPAGFGISTISDKGEQDTTGGSDDFEHNRAIKWEGSWKQGKKYELKYTILFPQMSPAFYEIGPLTFTASEGKTIFTEERLWQVAGDAIAFVKASAKAGGAAVTKPSFATLPSAGNLIIVYCWGWASGTAVNYTTTAVNDNQGNTYTRAVQSAASSGSRAAIFYAYNIGAPSGTFTVNVTAGGSGTRITVSGAAEYSGALTTNPIDKTASSTGNSNQPNTGTTAATTQAAEIAAISMAIQGTGTITITTPSGYTSPGRVKETDDAGSQAGEGTDKVLSATGTQTATWTVSPGSIWNGAIATFKAAAVPEHYNWYFFLTPLLSPFFLYMRKRLRKRRREGVG